MEARFSGGPLLTLLVDREGGPVDHEFCGRVASVVGPTLDEAGYEGPVEVSSPGVERPLTRPEHYRRFAGREVRVKTGEAVNGQRNFTGTIERAGEESFVLKTLEGKEEVELPFSSVTRAHLRETK